MEKLFASDILSKRERVMRALRHESVDRVPIHEQLSNNKDVIAYCTGKSFPGYTYTAADIGMSIRKTCDTCFPIYPPRGKDIVTDTDGFVIQNDEWTSWHVSRPFSDEEGAAAWIEKKTKELLNDVSAQSALRDEYRRWRAGIQDVIGETVLIDFSFTGFCDVFDKMGLEIFTFFEIEYPELLTAYLNASAERELNRIRAIADPELVPVILIPEDFATKQGPIFSPEFLSKYLFPYVKLIAAEWKSHGTVVLYHSDGNYKKAIPSLVDCGVDGFYCLEPSCGMDIVELKKAWPLMVWMGGVDGVDLMERGAPAQVRKEVRRQIEETDARERGGLFIATSSEINPLITVENFMAMVESTEEFRNTKFKI